MIMKRLFVPVMALLMMFLVAGTANAFVPAGEEFVTEQWYLIDTEEEAKTTCVVCVTDAKFVDPIENADWYLMDEPIEEKMVEPEVVEEVPEATLEGEIDGDAWYLR